MSTHIGMWQRDVVATSNARDHRSRKQRRQMVVAHRATRTRISLRAKVIAAVVLVVFAMTAYGVTRVVASTSETLAGLGDGGGYDLGSPALPWVGWMLVLPAIVLGKLMRGRAHAWGIWKSHLHAVKGIGLSLVLLAAAVLVLFGGLS